MLLGCGGCGYFLSSNVKQKTYIYANTVSILIFMNYIKRLIKVGNSTAIVLPSVYIKMLEHDGYSTKKVILGIYAEKLSVTPIKRSVLEEEANSQ